MNFPRVLALFAVLLPGVAGTDAVAQTDVRIATWNIETVGPRGDLQYDAALAVLNRIGADIVGINEVLNSSDVDNFMALATDAGYTYTVVTGIPPFGSMQNAFMSRFPFVGEPIIHTSPSLSGDPNAEDITRLMIEIVVDVPGNAKDLTLVVEHWKSSNSNADEFRRAVESFRVAQTIDDLDTLADAYVIMGDVNEEIDSVPRTPNPFTDLPTTGLPDSFSLGTDLEAELAGPGIVNDPFFGYLVQDSGTGTTIALGALQLDESDATRPDSGRRLDYLLVSQAISDLGPMAEVYDSMDEGLPDGLPKFGEPLLVSTSTDASDHFLVFADITVPAPVEPIPTVSAWSLLVMTLLLLTGGMIVLAHRRRRPA